MKLLFEPSALKGDLSEYLTSNEQFLLLFNDAPNESIQETLNILIEYYDSVEEEEAVKLLERLMSGDHFNFFGFYFIRLSENSTINDVRFGPPITIFQKTYAEALVERVPKILNL